MRYYSEDADRVDFDRHVRLEFRGAQISSRRRPPAGRPRELVSRARAVRSGGKSIARHPTQQEEHCPSRRTKRTGTSVFGRLAGYEDVNDADRLALDPVMRQVVGGRAVDVQAASASQMGRFETETLALPDNRAALADLNGQWLTFALPFSQPP
ncbi:MAG: transposase [Cypionkella sp.]|nr:transposase [Cypionkella sp.]